MNYISYVSFTFSLPPTVNREKERVEDIMQRFTLRKSVPTGNATTLAVTSDTRLI